MDLAISTLVYVCVHHSDHKKMTRELEKHVKYSREVTCTYEDRNNKYAIEFLNSIITSSLASIDTELER